MFFGPGRDKWAWLWNPFHPSALFCVLCAIVAMVVVSLLTRGGG
jgi:hypothetical protein